MEKQEGLKRTDCGCGDCRECSSQDNAEKIAYIESLVEELRNDRDGWQERFARLKISRATCCEVNEALVKKYKAVIKKVRSLVVALPECGDRTLINEITSWLEE